MQEYLEKLRLIYLYPSQFFESVKKESEYWQVLKFYVIIGLILTFISTVATYPLISYGLLGVVIPALVFFAILGVFLVPFFASAVVHLGILVFGGKQGYFNTFKPVTYGLTLGIVYSTLSSLITGVFLYSSHNSLLIIDNIGFLLIRIIIGIAGTIHTLVFYVKGISKYQNMTNWKVFLGVIFVPAILFFVFFIL